MKIIDLARTLTNVVNNNQFAGQYGNELALEKEVYNILKNTINKELHLSDKDLDKLIISHGETKEEKERWSKTKVWQDVIIAGCRNTSDIVVKLLDKETIAVQIKYAKGRITTAIQTVVGQCIIASLRHPVVIGLVFSKYAIKDSKKDEFVNLVNMLERHNIFLIVKKI